MSTTFGLEVYSASGNKIVSIDDDLMALATSGSITVLANTTSSLIPVSGMTNTPQWEVILTSGSTYFGQAVFGVYASKVTGGFTITNTRTDVDAPVGYWVVRLG